MNIITIDFETYYSASYSLSKMTTEEYIRDDLFEVIGVSLQANDGLPVWFHGDDDLKGIFATYNLENSVVVAHNARFDLAILSWIYGIKPKKIVDTLSMARALHGTEVGGSLKALAEYYTLGVKGTEVLDAKGKHLSDFTAEELSAYGRYCSNDVSLTYRLFKSLVAEGFPTQELELIDLTIRMFTEPVLQVNKDILEGHLKDIVDTKKEWLHKAGVEDRKQLMSNKQFAGMLIALGVEPPTKISLTTGKETYAFAKTDEAFKALADHPNPLVQILVAARLGVKSTIEETRTERFMAIADRGPLPIPLKYYAAHTGRWGGDDKINMQNLPRDSMLKYAVIPPNNCVFIDYDSSQIEARTLAWLAEETELVEAFTRGEDVYKLMASAIYNKSVEEITKDERFVGKTTILGCGYGMGADRFQTQLKTFGVSLPIAECTRIIDVYRTTYGCIPKLWRKASTALDKAMEGVTYSFGVNGLLTMDGSDGIILPNTLRVKYLNLRKLTDPDTKETETVYDTVRGKNIITTRVYGGKVIENVCQALARIIIGHQLRLVAEQYRVVMTVHDAIGCVVPEAAAEEASEYIAQCMRTVPSWAKGLPLDCEGSYGYSYGECK